MFKFTFIFISISYESQSSEVDHYFPNISSTSPIKHKIQSNPRRQSFYYDVLESENSDNLSDNEENLQPFRLRSGTDISDSVNCSRYISIRNLASN